MTNATARPAHRVFNLHTLGRAIHNGREWVLFGDGEYIMVVSAADYNRPHAEVDAADHSDAYTSWCSSADWADDETAIAVCRKLGEPGCSARTTLKWLDAEPS